MNPSEIISKLDHKGAKLYLKDGKLLCNAPKGAINADLFEAIASNKEALIDWLYTAPTGEAKHDAPEFEVVGRKAAEPLSYAQKRMMVLHAMQSDKSAFNNFLAFSLDGLPDISRLEAALKMLAAHHEPLRTGFAWENDEPVQTVAEETRIPLFQLDLRHTPEGGAEHQALQAVDQERRRPFDLDLAPLFRVNLVMIRRDKAILLLVSHYLIADDVSMALLAEEICRHYNKMPISGAPETERRFQYIDYVAWESAFLNSPAGERQMAFWSDRLRRFAGDKPADGAPSGQHARLYQTGSVEFEMEKEVTAALEALSRKVQASLFMTVYAVFTVLIAGVYNAYRFCCGTPIVNRGRMEVENMVGYFANTLLLGCELSGQQVFETYLRAVKTDALEAFSNSDIPFEFALEKSGNIASPLIRFMFTYAEDHLESLQLGSLSAHRMNAGENTPQQTVSELSLFVRRADNRLICFLQYGKDGFEPAVIDSMIRDMRKIAKSVAEAPHSTIDSLISGCESKNYCQKSPAAPLSRDLSIIDLSDYREMRAAAYKAPGNDTERMLAAIWEDILSSGPIGVRDDFFLLGGNSFQAVRMFAALSRQTGVNMPVSTLFSAPTIEDLAAMIESGDRDHHWSPVVPIQPDGDLPPLFFVHGAGGNVLLYRDLSRRLGKNQPFYGLQAKGIDGRSELLATVEEMAGYYAEEIRRIQPAGPYYLGGYCLGGQIAYEMARQLTSQGETVAFVGLLDTQRRWDLHNKRLPVMLKHQYQQVAFHLKNFFLADFPGKKAFVKEKTIELGRRVYTRLRVSLSVVAFALKLRSQRPLVVMETVNDRAANKYRALPYSGEITLFCPKRNYAGYEDPFMGWGGGLTKGVQVHPLSMYPAGMLVEPFVAELADKLEKSLTRARTHAAYVKNNGETENVLYPQQPGESVTGGF